MTDQLRMSHGTDFCTVAWAAELLGMSQRHVRRLMNPTADRKPILTKIQPLRGSRETGRHHTMLLADEVRQYKRARQVVTGA